MTPTPYQAELAQDIADWRTFEDGMAAFCRISGMNEGVALNSLRVAATPEQYKRVLSRLERSQEFEKLPVEMQRRALGEVS